MAGRRFCAHQAGENAMSFMGKNVSFMGKNVSVLAMTLRLCDP